MLQAGFRITPALVVIINEKTPFGGVKSLSFYMPFFLTMLDFLALPLESDFLSNFLLAAARVFMPCLSFGLPQPQVAHITSSSFEEQQSLSLLAFRLCPCQASSALGTYLLKTTSYPCRSQARLFSFRNHI